MRVALLCSGLGNIHRGHEVFARDLFCTVRGEIDVTLFKGGGAPAPGEIVIANIARNSPLLKDLHVVASPKWEMAVREQERLRAETETFAFACLQPLLEGGYDIIHCLEQEVCNIIYDRRHLFRRVPKVVFSNGGALSARHLPRCDFVQEYTAYNLSRSAKSKAFLIPHGVDVSTFRPGIDTDFRTRHHIPPDVRLVISVGSICYWHKRMDYLIEEVASLEGTHLVIVGQETSDSAAIKQLGAQRMGDRIHFLTLPHDELPKAYAAADVFALASLFETFGIVYIEAMAMGLPVVCTNHVNQRSIVKEGLFVDMRRRGALSSALRKSDRYALKSLGDRGRRIAIEHYALHALKRKYIAQYKHIAAMDAVLPKRTLRRRLLTNVRGAVRRFMGALYELI